MLCCPQCWYTPTRLCGVILEAHNVNLQCHENFKSFLLHGGDEYGQQHFPVKLQEDMGYHCNLSPLVL